MLKICYECAGVCGVDAGRFTLRELDIMSESRLRAGWTMTSHILCIIANANRDASKHPRAFRPDDFFPMKKKYVSPPKEDSTKLSISEFCSFFGAKRK